jgi:hypothetical protein
MSEFPWKIFHAIHATRSGGHWGFAVSYHKIRKLFIWTGMKKQIQRWCSECSICQQAKAERVKYPGLLQPLPIPGGAWKVITVNFLKGLHKSDHCNCIMVIVDKFWKYSHFVPLWHPFITLVVAKQFMEHVFELHRFPPKWWFQILIESLQVTYGKSYSNWQESICTCPRHITPVRRSKWTYKSMPWNISLLSKVLKDAQIWAPLRTSRELSLWLVDAWKAVHGPEIFIGFNGTSCLRPCSRSH